MAAQRVVHCAFNISILGSTEGAGDSEWSIWESLHLSQTVPKLRTERGYPLPLLKRVSLDPAKPLTLGVG